LAISQRIERPQEPVSKAQAEAKEELLRVRLAQMILNLNPDFEPREELLSDDHLYGSQNVAIKKKSTSSEVLLDDYYGQVREYSASFSISRNNLSNTSIHE
jgi:hypothetical protein